MKVILPRILFFGKLFFFLKGLGHLFEVRNDLPQFFRSQVVPNRKSVINKAGNILSVWVFLQRRFFIKSSTGVGLFVSLLIFIFLGRNFYPKPCRNIRLFRLGICCLKRPAKFFRFFFFGEKYSTVVFSHAAIV